MLREIYAYSRGGGKRNKGPQKAQRKKAQKSAKKRKKAQKSATSNKILCKSKEIKIKAKKTQVASEENTSCTQNGHLQALLLHQFSINLPNCTGSFIKNVCS